MKTQKYIILLFLILTAALAAKFLIIKNQEKKTLPVLQHIEEAHISVFAAPFVKGTEKTGKGENSFDGLFFSSWHKKIQYCLTYARYAKNPDVKSALAALEDVFKGYGFSYEHKECEIGGNPALKIEGSYEQNGRKYGVKEMLIKKDKNLWQVLAVYPLSPKYEKAAKDYINSIVLDEF
jgi:hypothetical protein